jgi:hypothetical protein
MAAMKTVQEYREYAQECRKLAKAVTESVVREQLLRMAETWERLAEDREATLRLDYAEASARLATDSDRDD